MRKMLNCSENRKKSHFKNAENPISTFLKPAKKFEIQKKLLKKPTNHQIRVIR